MTSRTFSEVENFTKYSKDMISSHLSFALWLVDDYTKNKPIGKIRVKIKETDKGAIRNLDGYYLFMNLNLGSDSGNYTVYIESDLYLPEETKIERSSVPDPKNPVIEIFLKPKPEYPFSENATLVRGQVISSSDKPIDRVRVGIKRKNIETITDSRGEFVIYFGAVKQEERLTLKINEKTKRIIVKEGKTVLTGKIQYSEN